MQASFPLENGLYENETVGTLRGGEVGSNKPEGIQMFGCCNEFRLRFERPSRPTEVGNDHSPRTETLKGAKSGQAGFMVVAMCWTVNKLKANVDTKRLDQFANRLNSRVD